MEKKFICTICNDEKPLSSYYLDSKGNRKSPRCKRCYCKKQYEGQKDSPIRLKYLEDNKELRKQKKKVYYQSIRHTDEYKEKQKVHDANYRKTDKYKLKRNERNETLRINPHIKDVNKQLRKAKANDKQRLSEINKINHYKPIAAKYINNNEPLIKEWKDIEGYEGLYKISNYGEVYSYRRSKSLSLIIDSRHGYVRVNLYGDTRKTHKVHRLVLTMFDRSPSNNEEGNHIDLDRTNNKINNLEWVTRQENADHRVCNNLNLIQT